MWVKPSITPTSFLLFSFNQTEVVEGMARDGGIASDLGVGRGGPEDGASNEIHRECLRTCLETAVRCGLGTSYGQLRGAPQEGGDGGGQHAVPLRGASPLLRRMGRATWDVSMGEKNGSAGTCQPDCPSSRPGEIWEDGRPTPAGRGTDSSLGAACDATVGSPGSVCPSHGPAVSTSRTSVERNSSGARGGGDAAGGGRGVQPGIAENPPGYCHPIHHTHPTHIPASSSRARHLILTPLVISTFPSSLLIVFSMLRLLFVAWCPSGYGLRALRVQPK